MPRVSLGLERINFYCDPAVLRGLKWLARARGTTYSELLREAAKEFVSREIRAEQETIKLLASTEGTDGRSDDNSADTSAAGSRYEETRTASG